MRRLTDTMAKNAEPTAAQYTLWDDLTGFGLRVSPGGTKTWTVVLGRERRRVTIGRYPLVALQTARSEARRILAEATLGKVRAPSTTFTELVELFFATHCTPQRN